MVWPILISVAVTPGVAPPPEVGAATPPEPLAGVPPPSDFFFSQPVTSRAAARTANNMGMDRTNQFLFDMYLSVRGDTSESRSGSGAMGGSDREPVADRAHQPGHATWHRYHEQDKERA